MRTLVLCDDYWHPARTARAGFDALHHSGCEFDWIEHAGEWSAERMAEYPLVVLTKANNISATDQQPWVTAAVEQAFLEYVRNGNGLLAIHSGTAGYTQTPVLRGLLGGVFVSHPPQCVVTVQPHSNHPLTTASAAFALKDEHYHMALDDAQADLFLTTTSEHGTQPAGWTRRAGAGRVAVLTPGHNVEVWLHPDFQTLISNALGWCGDRNR